MVRRMDFQHLVESNQYIASKFGSYLTHMPSPTEMGVFITGTLTCSSEQVSPVVRNQGVIIGSPSPKGVWCKFSGIQPLLNGISIDGSDFKASEFAAAEYPDGPIQKNQMECDIISEDNMTPPIFYFHAIDNETIAVSNKITSNAGFPIAQYKTGRPSVPLVLALSKKVRIEVRCDFEGGYFVPWHTTLVYQDGSDCEGAFNVDVCLQLQDEVGRGYCYNTLAETNPRKCYMDIPKTTTATATASQSTYQQMQQQEESTNANDAQRAAIIDHLAKFAIQVPDSLPLTVCIGLLEAARAGQSQQQQQQPPPPPPQQQQPQQQSSPQQGRHKRLKLPVLLQRKNERKRVVQEITEDTEGL